MAKVYPCGGIGKHIGGCECGQGQETGRPRRQKPGRSQGMALDALAKGKQPVLGSAFGGGAEHKKVIDKLIERGWAEVRGHDLQITDSGREAHQEWLED